MSPQEMINRYVHDVARRLPWRIRGDVESELRDLLTEQLAGHSGETADGRTQQMLVDFGTPADVASRYDTAPPVIDALDSRRFWQVAAALLLVVVVLRFALPDEGLGVDRRSDADIFWLVIAPIVGSLTLVFWAIGAARRRAARRAFDPSRLPPVPDPDAANRFLHAASVGLAILGTLVLALPGQVIDFVTAGRVAREAVAAFAYDPDFLLVRAPWVVAGLAFSIILLAWVGIQGRWSATTRRVELVANLYISLVLLGVMQAGPIFSAVPTDRMAKLWIALIVAATLLGAWWKWDRLKATRARLDALSP